MPDIKAKLKTFIDPFLKHPACLTNAILLVLTTGFEQAWEDINFKCPNKDPSTWWNVSYSLVFVAAPALALWILGILGSNVLWRICQGKNYRDKHECGCSHLCPIFLRAAVVPLTWVFVALMDGDFYACFKYLPSCTEGLSGPVSTSGSIHFIAGTSSLVDGVNCTKNSTVWNYENKSKSQLYAWLYLLICLLIGLCVVFCGKCRSRRTYFLHLYSEKLRKGERKLIEERLTKQAEDDGERNVGALMIQFVKDTTVSASEWESICREYTLQECGEDAEAKKSDAKKDAAETPGDAKEDAAETPGDAKKDAAETPGDANSGAGTQGKEVMYHSPLSEYLKDHEDLLDEYKKEDAKANAQSKEKQNPHPQPPAP